MSLVVSENVSLKPFNTFGVEVRARLFAEEVLSLREQRQRTRLWTDFRSQY